MVFFAYTGFEAVANLGEETRKPKRDLPLGLLGTLLVSTVLYVGVSLVVVGMVKYTEIDEGAPIASADPELDRLTPREHEVLQLIARGYAYKEIAQRLSISVKTVETHVSAVLRKLQLSSRHELARWATVRRLV